MIRKEGIKLPFRYDKEILRAAVAKALSVSKGEIKDVRVVREAVDARKKPRLCKVVTVECGLSPEKERRIAEEKKNRASFAEPYRYELPENRYGGKYRPVVIGTGPAGLFGGLVLAEAGLKPLLIEGGRDAVARRGDILAFSSGEGLKENSNIEFGEGGAGLFSDGKLTTGTKNDRHRFILETMIAAGAPEEIGYLAKPHIGSNLLGEMTMNIRRRVEAMGGTFCFDTRFVDIVLKGGALGGIVLEDENGKKEIDCDRLLLATGHSARKTVKMLSERGLLIRPKPFSVGVRIEHLQRDLNIAQYGRENAKITADYKLAVHLKNGRSVYTFCMCPGGFVVAAASEKGTVVTNGMSEYARDHVNGNSALLVSVRPGDFPDDGDLAGIAFQRRLEEKAFRMGGENGCAPAQRLEDFLNNRVTESWGKVRPSYRPGVKGADLNRLFPAFVSDSLKESLPLLGQKLRGFDDADAVLTAVETRSSAPFRLVRDENGMSSIPGIFPAGEGSGYAGGIMSSATDGMKIAEAMLSG